ncbi:hypothetical protein DIPPA_01258 [Diplonema papillatum]|nr:hypothetical protein DIPPA_01258 [Diplonema papillatum]
MLRRTLSRSALPASASMTNGMAQLVRPVAWDAFKHEDPYHRTKQKGLRRGISSPEPLQKRENRPKEVATRAVEAADYDSDGLPVESEPHAWEKLIQQGKAVPSDEFGRKTFILNTVRPDENTNLYAQIIIDALEEAKAEDIVVVETSNKWTYFPDFDEFVWAERVKQRKIDMMIFCSGLTARHIDTISSAVVDKAKKGLIPAEWTNAVMKCDSTKEEIYWRALIPCGKIVVDISHPHRREWKMTERKAVCQVTEHSGRFLEDMLTGKGWIRVWDFWSPNAPCLPRSDFEGIYARERSYGWERMDVLKPEYVVTDNDILRRHRHVDDDDGLWENMTAEQVDNLTQEQLDTIRRRLYDRKVSLNEPVNTIVRDGATVDELRAQDIANGALHCNYELEKDPTSSVSDEELKEYLKDLKRVLDPNMNIMRESPETKARKDQEWAEYEAQREARIRKFGYYDYIELVNDMQRRMLILPDGIRTWNDGEIPDLWVVPHPENYKGKPKDTHWGPGWYDVS